MDKNKAGKSASGNSSFRVFIEGVYGENSIIQLNLYNSTDINGTTVLYCYKSGCQIGVSNSGSQFLADFKSLILKF
jgi:hypothetical protein